MKTNHRNVRNGKNNNSKPAKPQNGKPAPELEELGEWPRRAARCDSKVKALTPEQQEQLYEWFFEEGLSVKQVHEKAVKELGFTGSKTSLQRYQAREQRQRWLVLLAEEEADARALNKGGSGRRFRSAAMKLLSHRFYTLALNGGQMGLNALGKLLLAKESLSLRQQALMLKREEQIFRRTRWEYDLEHEMEKRLPELNKIMAEEAAANDPYHEKKRINAMRRKVLGENLVELDPECAEEEEYCKLRREREAAYLEQMWTDVKNGIEPQEMKWGDDLMLESEMPPTILARKRRIEAERLAWAAQHSEITEGDGEEIADAE